MVSKNNNPKARGTELVVQELKDEVLIYDLNINKTYCLNPTSAIIWNLCDGNNSIADITKQVGKMLKQTVTDDLVWLALDQFKEDNLLDSNQEIEIKFDGLSRREVIRKVGLATLVALPVIVSLVAPTAAMAQSTSCVNPGGAPPGTVIIGGSCPVEDRAVCANTCQLGGANACCSGETALSGACPGCTCVCA